MPEWREAARHLNGSAEDYRNDNGATASLTDGLNRLRKNAVQLARSDARNAINLVPSHPADPTD